MEISYITVFTLNCWAIPFVSKKRRQRIKAITVELCKDRYDIVCLQEIWSISDFKYIKKNTKPILPYSHYFYNGVFGSGLCVFSKYKIVDMFFYPWPLNGYMHMIHHGDWFGGKGVGFIKLRCGNFIIYLYTAHLHAQYSTKNDKYSVHRMLEAYDLANFIQLTSSDANLILLAGDLNITQNDLGYRLLMAETNLRDAFLQNSYPKIMSATSESIRNTFTSKSSTEKRPEGYRIDYIMFGSNKNKVEIYLYDLPFPEHIPGKIYSYSDHEAILAKFRLTSKEVKDIFDAPSATKISILKECFDICKEELILLGRRQVIYLILSSILFVLLIASIVTTFPIMEGYKKCIAVLQLFIFIIFLYLFIMGTIWHAMEINAVIEGKISIKQKLNKLMVNVNVKQVQRDPVTI